MTDTDIFTLVSSAVWIVGLVLGYGLGYLGGSARVREAAKVRRMPLNSRPLPARREIPEQRGGNVVRLRPAPVPMRAQTPRVPRARVAPPR